MGEPGENAENKADKACLLHPNVVFEIEYAHGNNYYGNDDEAEREDVVFTENGIFCAAAVARAHDTLKDGMHSRGVTCSVSASGRHRRAGPCARVKRERTRFAADGHCCVVHSLRADDYRTNVGDLQQEEQAAKSNAVKVSREEHLYERGKLDTLLQAFIARNESQ